MIRASRKEKVQMKRQIELKDELVRGLENIEEMLFVSMNLAGPEDQQTLATRIEVVKEAVQKLLQKVSKR